MGDDQTPQGFLRRLWARLRGRRHRKALLKGGLPEGGLRKRRRIHHFHVKLQERRKAKEAGEAAKKVPWIRRSRTRVIVLRTVSWGFVAMVLLLLATYGAIKIYVTPSFLKNLIQQQVAEQTGGRIDIGKVEFNVLTGIRLVDVQFYPPAAGDPRGSLYGGDVDARPLAMFAGLSVKYSAAKAFAGRLHIKAMQLESPEFHLHQEDGVFNFDAINAYRAKHFPPEKEPEKAEEKKTAQKGEGLLPFSPALLYMPFEILTQNVGIKNLRFDLVQMEKGKVTQVVVTKGLSFDLGVHWFGRESSLWFDMTSPFERPFTLDVESAKGNIAVQTALNLHFQVEDLKTIGLDFAARVLQVQTPVAGYKDLGAFVKMRVAVADNYQGVTFDKFNVDVADALTYDLGGTVSVEDATFQSIALKLKQKLNIDLKNAAALARPFAPDLKADGEITVDDLRVDGTVEPDKLAKAADGVGLPYVSGVVWLEDVDVDYPSTGVSMEPVSGSMSIAAGPALSGDGSQVDLSLDVTVPRIDAKQKVPTVGTVEGGVENLTAKLTTRVLWPEMTLPIMKLSVEAEHVRASGDKIAKIDVPLFVDVDADGRKDLSRLALSANLELTDLAEVSAMADCQAQCTHFRVSLLGRMDTLERLHAIALPLGATLGLTDVMPTKLTGDLDFQVSARGRLPDPLKTSVPELLKAADVHFNSQLNLAKLNAKIPKMSLDVKNLETRLLASGSLAEQKVDYSLKFDGVSLSAPRGDQPPMPVSINRFSFETSVVNAIDGPLNLANPLPQLETGVDSKLFIGRVAVDGVLPQPLSDLQLVLGVEQQRLADIKLRELTFKAPDYGTTVTVDASTSLAPDFLATVQTKPGDIDALLAAIHKVHAGVKTQIIHSGQEKIPGGVKTSGKIDVRVALDSPDMKTATLDGEAGFDRFNVTLPSKDGKGPPAVVVEDIRGQIPFKQYLKLADVMALAMKKNAPAAAAAKDQKTADAAPGKNDVPLIKVVDDDEGGSAADAQEEQLDQAMGKFLAKTDDKLSANKNLVAMVDYGSIRPFYPERHPLSIKRVEVANLELSNMEFDMELRQNWFALNQFMINFLGGKIEGDFQLAFDTAAPTPKQIPQSLRTSVHLTRLDTRKLIDRFPNLKGKASSWNLFSNPYIDGTVHLAYDLKSSDISGGVEITSIGKEQLKMMLYYVDPFEQNPTIGSIRTALNVGEVRQVSIPLKNGEVGMAVDVRLLSAPIPTPKLERFPISQILENFKDQGEAAKDAPPAATPPPPPANNQAQAG